MKEADGQARLESGCIVIRVAVDNLSIITEAGPYSNLIKVTDPHIFVLDLLETLNEEAEDGTTMVHELFDKAILRAFENGAEGVEDCGEDGGNERT